MSSRSVKPIASPKVARIIKKKLFKITPRKLNFEENEEEGMIINLPNEEDALNRSTVTNNRNMHFGATAETQRVEEREMINGEANEDARLRFNTCLFPNKRLSLKKQWIIRFQLL